MKNDAMTRTTPENNKPARDRRWETSPVQEPVRSTVTHYGSYTVISDAYAAAHPEIAARVAEENAAFEALMKELRGN